MASLAEIPAPGVTYAAPPTTSAPKDVQKPPDPSSFQIIKATLTDYWTDFYPDLPNIEEPLVDLRDLWDELRLKTARWGFDDWETLTSEAFSSSLQDHPGPSTDDDQSVSSPTTISSASASMSGVSV